MWTFASKQLCRWTSARRLRLRQLSDTDSRYDRSDLGTLVPACCLKAAFFHSLEARLPGVLVITQRPSSNWRTHKVTTDACYRRASQCLQRRWLYSGHFTCWSTTPEANVLLFFRSIQSSIQSLVSSDRASTTESIRYHLLIRFREIATRKR